MTPGTFGVLMAVWGSLSDRPGWLDNNLFKPFRACAGLIISGIYTALYEPALPVHVD